MKKYDLDKAIKEKRNIVMCTDDLDESEIYELIFNEASQLKEKGVYHYKRKSSLKQRIKAKMGRASLGIKGMLKRCDRKMQRFAWYNNVLRKALLKFVRNLNFSNMIILPLLLMNKDEKYIEKLYFTVFNRKADQEGVAHNLELLRQGKVTKIDLFYIFYNSPENMLRRRVRFQRIAHMFWGR